MSLQAEIETSSVLTKIVVETKTTVADLLEKLKIPTGKYLAVLVDGKKADLKQKIHEGQKVIILPLIAGG
ncbi:MAG: MoaD/ThiS family protein [Promethearchaeota archaeon]